MPFLEALSSIAPYLPVKVDIANGQILWPREVSFALKAVARGPNYSDVQSGESLHELIMDMRGGSELPEMCKEAGKGMKIFFDRVISPVEAKTFFARVLPSMASLALKLPALLQEQALLYGSQSGVNVPLYLRILSSQNSGIVFLSQELVASLLACAFFCLYPSTIRRNNDLPLINFDLLFRYLFDGRQEQAQKIMCIVHYFERVTESMPCGMISYERKVLALEQSASLGLAQTLPDESFWRSCKTSLCDFTEEIRFMINPELIAGMFFLSAMSNNESIEVVGAERYSRYEGYGRSFTFGGDFVEKDSRDGWGRRHTRIVAIDALSQVGEDQFMMSLILRELNKAFCGFLDLSITSCHSNLMDLQADAKTKDGTNVMSTEVQRTAKSYGVIDGENLENDGGVHFGKDGATKIPIESFLEEFGKSKVVNLEESMSDDSNKMDLQVHAEKFHMYTNTGNCIGIATGNWGCGAFGGDLQLKSMLQWLAASQAGRPFLLYFTFGDHHAKRLQEIVDWIRQEGWCIWELWDMLLEYAKRRIHRQVTVNLFDWLLPKKQEGTSADEPFL
ncbi:hypothetical protein O6H91_23G052700 [Diphasiastrum complanatum]|uniref:Uncharacterized protein n=1 Tax=Diphasiastrum complanatum TaxID=34168 RepID=A0ACC2AAQ1_DIPCM|nr:hypothetical protein O6H91_23G052700 [Diphasiastrum complanatum]